MPTPVIDFNLPASEQRAHGRRLVKSSDGDTVSVEQPLRMVSCDTPEKAPYAAAPVKSQPKLDACRERLEDGFYDALPGDLREYLAEKLTHDAAERHIAAGDTASLHFDALLEQRLTLPDGKKRSVAVIGSGEILDQYGRLPAYVAPYYRNTASDPLPPRGDPARDTFNLNMISDGWAAFFPIYPSLPNDDDMNEAIAAAESAWDAGRGAWELSGRDLLLGYEFRACIKLGTAADSDAGIGEAFQRVCVDLRDLRIVGRFGFSNVPPPYRLWVWLKDLTKATAELGLIE